MLDVLNVFKVFAEYLSLILTGLLFILLSIVFAPVVAFFGLI